MRPPPPPHKQNTFAGWGQYDGAMIGKREKSCPLAIAIPGRL